MLFRTHGEYTNLLLYRRKQKQPQKYQISNEKSQYSCTTIFNNKPNDKEYDDLSFEEIRHIHTNNVLD